MIYVIAGHYSPHESVEIDVPVNSQVIWLDLSQNAQRLNFDISDLIAFLSDLGIPPSNIGLDLLTIAILIHAADTRVSRQGASEDDWTREFLIVAPVKSVNCWQQSTKLLEGMLRFLTGDLWSFRFRQRCDGVNPLNAIDSKLIASESFTDVCLFSGGLDSLIGAIDLFQNKQNPLLVSHAGDGANSDAQNTLFDGLRNHYTKRDIYRMRAWINIPKSITGNQPTEPTMRSRSFLFFALGAFAGSGLRRSFRLVAPENGFIALNVPLDSTRLGALSTRTTHPFYMARWDNLLNAIGIPGTLFNPYLHMTKGEMIDNCANTELLSRLIKKSMSCSAPTKGRWDGHPTQHCGYCLPCLIRRAAIRHAKLIKRDLTAYTFQDLGEKKCDPAQAAGRAIRSAKVALARLEADESSAKFLIHKPGPLVDVSDQLDGLASVYRRGIYELANLIFPRRRS